MYEPPETNQTVGAFAPTEIDVAMDKFIAEAREEFKPDPELEAAKTENVVESKEVTTEHADNTVPEPTPDPTERGLERLVAREVELREREGRLTAAEKEMEALRARVRELEPRALTSEHIDKIKLSPNEGLRALGLDPDEVIRAALVEKLGDKANDPETKALLERSKIRREMESLRAQVQAAERERAAQAYYSQISTGANDYVKNTEGLSKYPSVAHVAKTDPNRVFSEIMEEITRDAQVRAAREPNGDVISYEEAARRVESRWSEYKKWFSPTGTQNPGSVPANNASTPVAKTNVEATLGSPESKSPPVSQKTTIKPPEKPLAPWLQVKQDEEEGIRAAIAEWRRVEGKS